MTEESGVTIFSSALGTCILSIPVTRLILLGNSVSFCPVRSTLLFSLSVALRTDLNVCPVVSIARTIAGLGSQPRRLFLVTSSCRISKLLFRALSDPLAAILATCQKPIALSAPATVIPCRPARHRTLFLSTSDTSTP